MKKLLIGLVLVLGAAAWGFATAKPELERVVFLPQWRPQAQFAGYYVAQEKGFYRREGLAVTLLRGGSDMPVGESLEQGLAHFGTLLLATGITERSRKRLLVNVAQLGQRSAFMLVARKSSGISQPQDLQGKKVGLWREEFQVQPRAFLRKYGLSVTVVPQSANMNLFLRGGVDAASAMWYNEYYQLINTGLNPEELTTFFMADHGLNFPGDGLYCLESTYLQNPSRARRFVAASLEGWRYAWAHPEEALDIVMKYVEEAREPTNRVHQRWMLERLRDLMAPPNSSIPLGYLPEAAYLAVAEELKKDGSINHIPEYRAFYRDTVSPP